MEQAPTPQSVVDYFHKQTKSKEPYASEDNALDLFVNGIAEYQADDPSRKDEEQLRNVVEAAAARLIPNFREPFALSNIIVPSVINGSEFPEKVQEQLDLTPVVFIVSHPSIASPYLAKRKINFPDFDENVAKRLFSVAGPRPMTLNYNIDSDLVLSPFMLGVALGNVALTGTNTGSTDDAPFEVKEWLKDTGNVFKENLAEIVEPKEQGENNAIVICPAGRIAKHNGGHSTATEYRMRTTRYLEEIADRVVFWPIGIYDELLVDQNQPSSIVGINPALAPFRARSEDEIFTMQQIAVDLSQFPFGHMKLESALSARTNRGVVASGRVLKRTYSHLRTIAEQ